MSLIVFRAAIGIAILSAVARSSASPPDGGVIVEHVFEPSLVYSDVPPGYWTPGGAEGRIGSPYFYRPQAVYPADTYGELNWNATGPAHRFEGFTTHYGEYAETRLRPGYPTDPWTYHFGPGFYRHSELGHYRFPYYSYRRPWYFQGPPTYNRDTNFAW